MNKVIKARPCQLVIVRHGESARNAAKKGSTYFADEEARASVAGIPDHLIQLTPKGLAQARVTGVHLKQRFGTFDYAYTSGYSRTDQTLSGLLEAYTAEERQKIRIRTNLFIRERDPGYTYDMTTAEAEAAFPYLKKYWEMFGGYFGAPPGGESLAKVSERVYLFLNMLFRDRVGQNILIVTHGGTIRCIRTLLEHWDYQRSTAWPRGESPKNCGVTVYQFDPGFGGHLVLQEYNTVYGRQATEPRQFTL